MPSTLQNRIVRRNRHRSPLDDLRNLEKVCRFNNCSDCTPVSWTRQAPRGTSKRHTAVKIRKTSQGQGNLTSILVHCSDKSQRQKLVRSEPEMKSDADIFDVILEELPVRRRTLIQLEHERGTRRIASPRAGHLYTGPHAGRR